MPLSPKQSADMVNRCLEEDGLTPNTPEGSFQAIGKHLQTVANLLGPENESAVQTPVILTPEQFNNLTPEEKKAYTEGLAESVGATDENIKNL